MKWTEEQLRQVIIEETNKFLDEPYDQSFDLVLESMMAEKAGDEKHLAYLKSQAKNPETSTRPDRQKAAAQMAADAPAQRLARRKAKAAARSNKQAAAQASAQAPAEAPAEAPAQAPAQAAQNNEQPPNASPTWRQRLAKAGTAVKKFVTDPKTKKVAGAIAKGAGGLAKGALGAVGTGVGAALGGLAKGAVGAFQSKGPAAQIAKAAKKAEKAGLDKDTILKLAKLYKSGALGEKQIATLKLVEKCSKSDKIQIIKENEESIIIDV